MGGWSAMWFKKSTAKIPYRVGKLEKGLEAVLRALASSLLTEARHLDL